MSPLPMSPPLPAGFPGDVAAGSAWWLSPRAGRHGAGGPWDVLATAAPPGSLLRRFLLAGARCLAKRHRANLWAIVFPGQPLAPETKFKPALEIGVGFFFFLLLFLVSSDLVLRFEEPPGSRAPPDAAGAAASRNDAMGDTGRNGERMCSALLPSLRTRPGFQQSWGEAEAFPGVWLYPGWAPSAPALGHQQLAGAALGRRRGKLPNGDRGGAEGIWDASSLQLQNPRWKSPRRAASPARWKPRASVGRCRRKRRANGSQLQELTPADLEERRLCHGFGFFLFLGLSAIF